ncbi:hypothetical protein [Patulibacter americanus]|uniref:hypothetical protein n=1 Tax=Patulibacter americanus TaxID=588672 RepID=UPI0003B35AA4|nr:hypothetical protein [Patulibacter americanus]
MAALPVIRAPMRARTLDTPPGAGADHAVSRGLVGTGDPLDLTPATLDEAVAAAADRHGEKAGRMLRRFAGLPTGAFVWTRISDTALRLGRITGPWRYDDADEARAVGIVHVRDAVWLPRPLEDDEAPPAVPATFGRGGRNLQRIHDAEAERGTAALWAAHGG